ncbi:TIGR00366 family protein, partial [Streptomyces scabiei]
VDQNKLIEPQNKEVALTRPADHIEHSRVLGMSIGLLGLAYLAYYFIFNNGSLNLNSVIGLFLFTAILLHQTPHNLLASLQ